MNTFDKKNRQLKIGEVYLMKFSGENNEQCGWRPGVVFQNNVGNMFSPNIIALPLTSSVKKCSQPTHVIILAEDSGLLQDSMVLCENPQRMSKRNIGKYITTLSNDYMKQIASGSLLATSAIAYLDPESLMNIWRKTSALNCAA